MAAQFATLNGFQLKYDLHGLLMAALFAALNGFQLKLDLRGFFFFFNDNTTCYFKWILIKAQLGL